MLKKNELICKKGPFTNSSLLHQIFAVIDIRLVPNTNDVTYTIRNLQNEVYKLHLKKTDKVPFGYYKLLANGATLAYVELHVLAIALTRPGITPECMVPMIPNYRDGVTGIKKAITRIGKKGFSMIGGLISEPVNIGKAGNMRKDIFNQIKPIY